MLTLAAELFLIGFAGWKWSYEQKQLNILWSYEKTHNMGGIIINDWSIAVIFTSFFTMVFLYLFFKYTKFVSLCGPLSQNKFATKLMEQIGTNVFSFLGISRIGALAAMFYY